MDGSSAWHRAIVVVVLAAGSGGGAFLACDLFHSTDFQTLCDLNSTADACSDGALPSGAVTNFCTWSSATAYSNAQHACAWLSACESPLGNNDFGPCMVSALLAYDCTANRSRPVLGPLHDYWDALWQAKTCADVDRAVFPGAGVADKVPLCESAGFVNCGAAYDGGDNSAVRVECEEPDASAQGENCIAQGRTCAGGACVGAAKTTCDAPGCSTATELDDCNDAGVDQGTNCALFGAGECVSRGAGPACTTTGASCEPTTSVTCNAGVASGCPSGTSESVSCNVLTGPGSCNPGPASPAWDVSSACFLGAGTCSADSCSGSDTLVSCARGTMFTISCSGAGLAACAPTMTIDGLRAACGRPSP